MQDENNYKTTLYLDSDDYRKLKALAHAKGKPAAALVREAIAEYTARHAVPRPRAFGAVRSGRSDLSERAEELLTGMGTSE